MSVETELIERWHNTPLAQMSTVGRYSAFPVHHRENVAEHSYYVMFYSWVLAQHFEEIHGFKIDYRSLLQKGMFHDLDESITGDIIRSFKWHDTDLHNAMTRVSTEVMTDTFHDLPGGGPLIVLDWQTSKDDSIEGRLVDLADVWAVYIYLNREIALGNKWAMDHVKNVLYKRIMEHPWDPLVKNYGLALGTIIHRECNLL